MYTVDQMMGFVVSGLVLAGRLTVLWLLRRSQSRFAQTDPYLPHLVIPPMPVLGVQSPMLRQRLLKIPRDVASFVQLPTRHCPSLDPPRPRHVTPRMDLDLTPWYRIYWCV